MKLQNTFVQGKMNKDIDERLLPKGQYPHAENIRVANTDGSDMGAIENVEGNTPLTAFALTNAKTIGTFEDSSNQKIYFFTTSDEKDLVVEYDYENVQTNILLESTNPNGLLNFSRDNLITGVSKIINGDFTKDLLVWTDDRNAPRIINIERAKTYAVDGFIEDDISLIKKPPVEPPTTTLTFTSTSLENNIEDRFLSFAYRYRYLDGEYSALSPFSQYNFAPSTFQLDYQTMENNGMVNSFNAVDIGFDTGSSRVSGIQVVFKESNSNSPAIIETFNKEDEGWGDNEFQSLQFSNSKQYAFLPEDELFRQFDNVPRLAKALELIGNRVVFGNYLEGYDLVDVNNNPINIDYTLSLQSNNIATVNIGQGQGSIGIPLDLSGLNLTENSSIILDLDLDTVSTNGFSRDSYSFIFPRDYTSIGDLATDADFIFFIEDVVTNQFLQNYTNNLGAGINFTGTSGFNINYDNVNEIIRILPPTNVYEDTNNGNALVVENWLMTALSNASFTNIGVASSLKTNRSYEIGIVYMDEYGRATTVLTDESNTIYVPQEFSISQNKIVVDVNHNPPEWATHYKFVIKQDKSNYETIYTNIFYQDGLFRWVKLEGANVNKVQEGDTLIVKSDLGGVREDLIKTRVIELVTQPRGFIEGNENQDGDEISEESGLYMKIKPQGFDMSFTEATSRTFEGGSHLRYPVNTFTQSEFGERDSGGVFTPYRVGAGTSINIYISFEARGSISYFAEYDRSFKSSSDYNSIQEWFDAEVGDLGSFGEDFTRGDDTNNNRGTGWDFTADGSQFYVRAHRDGTASRNITTTVRFEVLFSEGTVIFETEPELDTQNIYYETGQVFEITGNNHQGNLQNQSGAFPARVELNAFNCYVQGNGAESFKFKDTFNGNRLNIDLRPTTTSVEEFRAVRRYADLTYSAVYNENSNINGLNEFNLSLGNFKEDIDKKDGEIQKLFSRDTNLVVFQEDKVSYVLFGKDLLVNADGTSNVTSTEDVLGQQVPYAGEYGISRNPESFTFDGFNIYFTDAKRGAVMRLGLNGLTEISKHGMDVWFKDRFRESLDGYKLGAFDPYHDQYLLHLEDNGYNISFDESVTGWTSFHSFLPDFMIGMNNEFFSFRDGNLYQHHSRVVNPNNYYGVDYPSRVSVMVNDHPSEIKELQAISLEGNCPWDLELLAYVDNKDNSINSSVLNTEFLQKEGHWYAYARRNEDTTHLDSKSSYGIGRIQSFTPTTITVLGGSDLLCVGDEIYSESGNLIGVLTSVTSQNGTTVLGFNSLPTLIVNTFVFGRKDDRIEGGNLRGYTMRFNLEINKPEKIELFAVNAEVMKSFS